VAFGAAIKMVDVSQYKELFVDESREHLQCISENLLTLEKEPENTDALNETFRALHTLKSMAATMGLPEMEELSHEMENVLDVLRKGEEAGEGTVDLMFESLDGLETLVESVATGKTVKIDLTALHKKLKKIPAEKKEDAEVSTVAAEGKDAGSASPTIRVGIEKIQALQNLVEELAIAKMSLLQIASKYASHELDEITATIDRHTSELQDRVMQMRMFPVGYLFDKFPRAVRDLSKKTGKEVDFIVAGKEIELDRLVLDEINDAVLHLLRNAVDHGIENPEERKNAGKEDKGKVILSAIREGNHVVVSVEDDGRGIVIEELKKVAVEKGIVTSEAAARMNDADVYDLLSEPGLSTAREITDISGRGVGFDVVRSKVKSLGGSVRITSEKGRGTNIELHLPLTIAIIKALLVGVEDERYAIPLDSVQEIVAVSEKDLKSVEGKGIFGYREHVLPLLMLKNILDVPGDKDSIGPVVVVERAGKFFGLMVGKLIGQQEIVVKSLEVKDRKEFVGATILGDGTVALILDVSGLMSA
jgi:two-component system chemotaxis sensor kinase CheA